MSLSLIGLIADDLTGAMDAGMQLLSRRLAIHTALTVDDVEAVMAGADVVVANTQSRNIDPHAAYRQVRTALDKLAAGGCRAWYKKIDSTLRGNIGAELKAVLDSGVFDLVITAPALPYNKRTTINGIHYVDGVELAEIELAKDPFAPIAYSEIGSIIKTQFEGEVGHLPLDTVRRGSGALAAKAKEYLAAGIKVLTADAETERDLRQIASAAGVLPCRVLLCGSAGLFRYLDEAYSLANPRGEGEKPKVDREPYAPPEGAPVLVLSGSPAQMSKRQIQYLEDRRPDTVVVAADIAAVPEGEAAAKTMEVISTVIGHLRAGKNVALDAAGTSKEAILSQTRGMREQLDRFSSTVQTLLRDAAAAAAAQVPLAALVLFGGDTAVAVLKQLGGQGIAIVNELEPYIPLGRLIGGAYAGLLVVTKAGGFGSEDSLLRILETRG